MPSQNSGPKGSRPASKDGAAKNIWSSMLDGVASGKRLPEKSLLILGSFFLFLIMYNFINGT